MIAVVEMFFIFLMVVHNNPFSTFLTTPPPDGQGLNPLLQNFYMAIHPPSLYIGFVAMTIPFAFGMAALITGHLDDAWLRAVRRWTMIGWLFLSFGLTLGMLWAYEELGWGGYWGWDPVENAGLLPWFTATAFLHSVMVQERRGMLRVWNVTLVILTFFLTIFGTFMTRSGVVQSVHAFGEDRELARLFTIFMVADPDVQLRLVIYRLPLLRSRNELDSWVSREAAFLANNWILLFSAFFVLFATMFPTLSEAVTGGAAHGRAAVLQQVDAADRPDAAALTGVGPLLAWRKSTVSNLVDQFLWPVVARFVVAGALVALGVRVWARASASRCARSSSATIAQEFIRGARSRRRRRGTDGSPRSSGSSGRSKRRYGGYIVHLGIVLMFLGFAGEGFKQEEQALLKPGEQVTVGAFTVRHDALRVTDDAQKQMITGPRQRVRRRQADRARWSRRSGSSPSASRSRRPRSPSAAASARTSTSCSPATTPPTRAATYAVTVNPLVNWIWFGFGIMALGTGIALLPERARVRRGEGAGGARRRRAAAAARARRLRTPRSANRHRPAPSCASSSKARSSAPAAAAGR